MRHLSAHLRLFCLFLLRFFFLSVSTTFDSKFHIFNFKFQSSLFIYKFFDTCCHCQFGAHILWFVWWFFFFCFGGSSNWWNIFVRLSALYVSTLHRRVQYGWIVCLCLLFFLLLSFFWMMMMIVIIISFNYINFCAFERTIWMNWIDEAALVTGYCVQFYLQCEWTEATTDDDEEIMMPKKR